MTKDIENKKTTIDPLEHEKFSKLAEEWWDPNGKFKTLHKFNPTRIAFIREKIINHFNNSADETTSDSEDNSKDDSLPSISAITSIMILICAAMVRKS